MKKVLGFLAVLILLAAGIFVWNSEAPKPKPDWEVKLDEIQALLSKKNLKTDTSDWIPYENKEFGISGKMPPKHRMSDYFKSVGKTNMLYFTILSEEEDQEYFKPENQKPGTEGLFVEDYGIVMTKDANLKNLSPKEWFVDDYRTNTRIDPYGYPSELRDTIVKERKKEIYYYYSVDGPGRQLSAVVKKYSQPEAFSFVTYISRDKEEALKEIKEFKELIHSLSLE